MTCIREASGALPYPGPISEREVRVGMDERFGRRIYEERMRRGLSADGVARLVPCPVWRLFNWETGREIPNVRQIRDLARALRLSEYELTAPAAAQVSM